MRHERRGRAVVKSISSNLSLLLGLSVIAFLGISVATLTFLSLETATVRQTESYRTGLSTINRAISILGDIQDRQESLTDLDGLHSRLRETIAEIEQFIATTDYVMVEPGLNTIADRVSAGNLPPDEAITLLGDAARRLSTSFYRRRERIGVGTSISMGVQLVFLLLFMGTLILMRRFVRRFLRTVAAGLSRIRNQYHAGSQQQVQQRIQWKEEQDLSDAVEELAGEIAYDQELGSFTSQGTLEDLLPKIFPLIHRHIPCTRIALAFIDGMDNVIAETAYTTFQPVHLEPGFVEPMHHTTLGPVRSSGDVRVIHDLQAHYDNVHKSRSTELLLREGLRSNLTVPLFLGVQCIGFLFISHNSPRSFTDRHLRYARQAANALKQTLYYHYLLQELLSQASSAFVNLTAKRDNETALHILRMSRYSQIIAKRLLDTDRAALNPRFVREVQWFAQLHDIGKIGIPDEILLKPGPLDDDQWKIMRSHVTIGEEIISDMGAKIQATTGLSLLSTALEIISGHHEKYDGSGYPRGLSASAIPLGGRIVALADVFDALSSRRPYKDAFPIDKTLDIIRRGVGSHFDPMVFAAFEESLETLLEVYEEYKEV